MDCFDTDHKFLRIGSLLCFFVTIIIAVLLRTYPLVRQHSNLNYPYVIDPDSARFVHQAQLIVDTGKLPEVDRMRWYPLGRRSASQLTLHSYILANLYKFVRQLWPQCSLQLFAAIYPVIVSAFCWLVLYLVIKELFGVPIALMSLNIIVVMPLMVARSVAGYADQDALSLLLGLGMYYFYIRAYQHKSRVRFVFQLISGCIAGVLALTWRGVGLFSSVIVFAEWARLIFIGYRRTDSIAYVLWLIPYLLCLFLKRNVYFEFIKSFTLIAVGVPLLFLLVITSYSVISSSDRFVSLLSLSGRVPIGTSISFVCLVGTSIALISIFSPHAEGHFNILSSLTYMSQPFGTSRLAKTILELQSQNFVRWTIWPGIFFLAIIAGASMLMSRLADNLHIDRWLSITFLQIVIGCIAYTELVPKEFPSAAKWAKYIYGLCLLTLPFGVLLSSIFSWKQKKSVILDRKALFLLCWLLVTLLATQGGLRFHFFFVPVAVVTGMYALVTVLKCLFDNRYAIVWLCIVIGLILSELWVLRDLKF